MTWARSCHKEKNQSPSNFMVHSFIWLIHNLPSPFQNILIQKALFNLINSFLLQVFSSPSMCQYNCSDTFWHLKCLNTKASPGVCHILLALLCPTYYLPTLTSHSKGEDTCFHPSPQRLPLELAGCFIHRGVQTLFSKECLSPLFYYLKKWIQQFMIKLPCTEF